MKLVLLTLLLLPSVSPSLRSFPGNVQATPEWKYLFTLEDDKDTWKTYYDATNIERQQKGITGVWLKQIPITKSEAERQRLVSAIIENRKLNKMSTQGYDKFAYSLTLVELDCSGRQIRKISIKDYDEADKLLGRDSIEGLPFGPVEAGSTSEVIWKAVCK